MLKIKLTDNQRAVLNAAAHSANLAAWPLPKKLELSAGSAAIVIRGLLQKGLLEKRRALGSDPVWKEEGGKPVTLVITKAGLAASGIHAADESGEKGSVAAKKGVVAAVSNDAARRPRAGTKLAILVGLLKREQGATIAELAEGAEWQAHSVRGVLSGALAKRCGLTIVSQKIDGRRVYRANDSTSPDAS